MKLQPTLAIVLTICLIAIALSAVPAQAACVPRPELALSTDWGVPGDIVTLSGEHFGNRNWVDIYYDGTPIAEVKSTSTGYLTIDITIPDSARGRHEVIAEAPALEADITRAEATFTVWPGLTITPDKGPIGTTVTVRGRGFVASETVIDVRYYIGDSYETVAEGIPVDAIGSWEVSFEIPFSTRGEHKIDAWGTASIRTAIRPTIFEVTPGISIDKSSGSTGETVTTAASGFGPDERHIRILFGGQPVVTGITADSTGRWQASFQVPEMPGGEYIITAEGELTRSRYVRELTFQLGPSIVLSPEEGHAGMEVTVTGRGFDADEDLVIMYDSSEVETVRADDNGSFEVGFAVPESHHGQHVVMAEYGGENHASAIFVMESDPPPVPEPTSPPDGGRVGLIRKATPTLEWSQVSDASGVYYSLQIATGADVTADKQLADPIATPERLKETSYAPDNPLARGTYYWIVQAVDGADNKSAWSDVYSFRVGLLPRWALIAIIVVAAVLLLALVRTILIRRRYYFD